MLKYVQQFRKRFSLQINDHQEEDNQLLYIKDSRHLEWHTIGLDEYGSQTAVVRGLKLGTQVKVSSHPFVEQCFLLADLMTDRAVGRIDISNVGAITIHDFPTWSVGPNIQSMYEHRITAIIGFRGPATLNFTDEANGDVDILRLKSGQAKLFVPAKYLKPTPAYDTIGNRCTTGAITSGTATPADQNVASTSTGGFTFRPIVLPPFQFEPGNENDNNHDDNNNGTIEVDDASEAPRTEAVDDSEVVEVIEPVAEAVAQATDAEEPAEGTATPQM